jgi:hypothetical protein
MPVPEPPSSIVAFDSGIRVIINIVRCKDMPARLQLAVGEREECCHAPPLLDEAEARRIIAGLQKALEHLERLK